MPNNILITPGSASIQFSGSAASTIRLQVEASGSIAFYGNSGSLFGISDSLSGSLMSVNDISGLPILEVFSDDRVVMGSFNKNTLVVTGSRVGIDKAVPTTDLDISGSVFITGSLRMSSGGITGSLFGTASVATSASYALSSSFAPTILPSGVVSSSQQINTGSFTGSFVGDFTGSLLGTASNATSASYALSASYAPSAPGGGVTSVDTGDGLTGGPITTTGTISLDTGSVHFLDGIKKELNTEGVVSSSLQINTGSFSGSFTGTLLGTSSWATNAISASYFTGSVSFPSGLIITGSVLATTVSSSLFIGPLTGTSSWASNAISSSYALSASNAITSSYVLPSGLPSGIVSSSLQINTGSFSGSITSASFATTAATSSYFSGYINFPNGLDVTGSLFVTGSGLIVSGTTNLVGSVTASRLLAPSITGSLFGTSSVATSASFATTSSFAVSASWAPSAPGGGITSLTAGDGLTGGTITTTGTITLDTGSVHFLDGVKKELNTEGVVSSSLQINTGSFSGSITTASFATTSSYALSASFAPTVAAFPFSGSAIITGSLLVSSSVTKVIAAHGSINNFFEIEVNNKNTGNVASSDFVATSDNGNDLGNYINMGINSTTYNSGLVGGPSDGYMYLTSSVGELHVGNASTGVNSNIRLFAGGPSSDSTTRVFISSSGHVGINTTTNLRNTLSVNGSISASAGITGSFTGSFSGSLDRFNPATLRIAVGTTAPASPAINDLWVDTN